MAAVWEPVLSRWADKPIEQATSLAPAALAALTARRAARAQNKANLLPAEFSTRYQQQFIDRLWMGGLGALAIVYLFGVLIYRGALSVLQYQTGKVQGQVAALSGYYTNALQLRERVRILQEQVNLKFAALDCLKAASEKLPPELTLKAFSFSKGNKISLSGTSSTDDDSKITKYNDEMTKATQDGKPLFVRVNPPNIRHPSPNTVSWDFECILQPTQVE